MASTDVASAATRRYSVIAFAAVLLVSLPLVLGLFGHLHPALDSLAHLRAHLAVLMAVAALPLFLARARLHALVALLLGVGAFATTLPVSTFTAAQARVPPAGGTEPIYRLLHLNLRFDHAEPGRVLSLIARERPDVLAFNEVSAHWQEQLDLIAAAYPHRLVCPGDNPAGGVAILSRRPFVDGSAMGCSADGRLARASVDFGGRPVDVAALHLHWPWPWRQVAEIRRLAPVFRDLDEAGILATDLNATPWSAAFAAVVEAGGFVPPTRVGPTWLPYALPAVLRPIAGMPIDHVMTKAGVTLHALRALDDAGSDHLPLLATFSVKPAEVDRPVAVATLAVVPGR